MGWSALLQKILECETKPACRVLNCLPLMTIAARFGVLVLSFISVLYLRRWFGGVDGLFCVAACYRHFGIELLFIGCVYGLAYGVIASYSRSLFGQLIPPGYETQFFGLFEITDKGSSWMGPIVVFLTWA